MSIRINTLVNAKPGDEIAGHFVDHIYAMQIEHMVYTSMDVTDAVEEFMVKNGLTEPTLKLNPERTERQIELDLGKWEFSQVSEGMVLIIGRRVDMALNQEREYGYMHQRELVMIHTPGQS